MFLSLTYGAQLINELLNKNDMKKDIVYYLCMFIIVESLFLRNISFTNLWWPADQ